MHTYAGAFTDLTSALQVVYDSREAGAIAQLVLEHITGVTRLQRITDKDKLLTDTQAAEYDRIKPLLALGMPLQYILGTSWFMGREFMVNEHVLIPRPETEELVQWIADDWKNKESAILDIGTGSGCIPISLKLLLPTATITSIDISEGASGVAKQNANKLGADVVFMHHDFLDTELWGQLPYYDVIASNPPYIPETESATLHSNVRDFEPGLALFVPGDDALLFYRHIALFGQTHLKEGGAVYCELHVDYALQTKQLFADAGYTGVQVKEDMHGNLRMLKAQK